MSKLTINTESKGDRETKTSGDDWAGIIGESTSTRSGVVSAIGDKTDSGVGTEVGVVSSILKGSILMT